MLTPHRATIRALDVAEARLALAEEIAADVTATPLGRQGRTYTGTEKRAVLFAIAFWSMALREPVVMDELRRCAA